MHTFDVAYDDCVIEYVDSLVTFFLLKDDLDVDWVGCNALIDELHFLNSTNCFYIGIDNTKEKHNFTFSDSRFRYRVVYRQHHNKCDLDSYAGYKHYDGTAFEEHIDQYFFIVDDEPITNKQLWLKQMGEPTSLFGFGYE